MEEQPTAYRFLKQAPIEHDCLLGTKFVNECDNWKGRSLGCNVLSFFYNNIASQPSPEQCARQLPTHFQNLKIQPPEGTTKVTWLSHATVLIQDGDVNIITDPVFVDRIAIYKRLTKKPAEISELPHIHIVLISHDHNDHFDQEAVRTLIKRDNPTIVMGLMSQDLLEGAQSRLLDWGASTEINVEGKTYRIDFLPSCHWSGRGLFDHFKRLWGGFLLTLPSKRTIYYPGDTGYEQQLFQQIHHKHGDVNLCLLPIGAYLPREFLCYQHIDPEEAVRIHQNLCSKQSLGIHWGTFQLACQGFMQPKHDLERALREEYRNLERSFCCIQPGQSLILGIDVVMPQYLPPITEVRCTWLGHSAVLLEYNGEAILVNPHFSSTAEMKNSGSINRLTHPTPILECQSKLQGVLLTSSDADFVRECSPQNYQHVRIMFPNSNSRQTIEVRLTENIVVTAVQYLNQLSYVIAFSNNVNVCIYGSYADQTALPRYALKGRKIHMALLPIRPLVMDAKRTFKADELRRVVNTHRNLGATRSIAVNWGAFNHPNESVLQPKHDAQSIFTSQKVSSSLLISAIGRTFVIDNM